MQMEKSGVASANQPEDEWVPCARKGFVMNVSLARD